MSIPTMPTEEDCRQALARLAREQPSAGLITDDKIIVALSQHARGPDDYFMTTRLFWECECSQNYFHLRDALRCPTCGEWNVDCADARIHELALSVSGLCLDWQSRHFRESLDEYNLKGLERQKHALPLTPAA